MRIIAGEKRGLVLLSPSDDRVRPTHDRVREAVFGKLQFFIPGKTFLDAFAGSGAVGIEALSRGAECACFADNAVSSLKIINENIKRAGFENRSRVFSGGFESAVSAIKPGSVDIVYMDPPYEAGLYDSAVNLVIESGILCDGAYVILESDSVMPEYPGLTLEKNKKYGKAYISYYRYEK